MVFLWMLACLIFLSDCIGILKTEILSQLHAFGFVALAPQ
jgi:hypothetical protein